MYKKEIVRRKGKILLKEIQRLKTKLLEKERNQNELQEIQLV